MVVLEQVLTVMAQTEQDRTKKLEISIRIRTKTKFSSNFRDISFSEGFFCATAFAEEIFFGRCFRFVFSFLCISGA